MITLCSFDSNKSKHDYYGKRYYGRGKDCMRKLCEDLRKNLTEISKHEKKCYHYRKKKKNHITNKNYAMYAKKSLKLY